MAENGGGETLRRWNWVNWIGREKKSQAVSKLRLSQLGCAFSETGNTWGGKDLVGGQCWCIMDEERLCFGDTQFDAVMTRPRGKVC